MNGLIKMESSKTSSTKLQKLPFGWIGTNNMSKITKTAKFETVFESIIRSIYHALDFVVLNSPFEDLLSEGKKKVLRVDIYSYVWCTDFRK